MAPERRTSLHGTQTTPTGMPMMRMRPSTKAMDVYTSCRTSAPSAQGSTMSPVRGRFARGLLRGRPDFRETKEQLMAKKESMHL